MHPNKITKTIINEIKILNIGINFSGYFIDLWILKITAFPSKLNTATPKNIGMLYGIIEFKLFMLLGLSLIIYKLYVNIVVTKVYFT